MPPSPTPFTPEELGSLLVELSILTDAQWDTALSRAGGSENLPSALDLLTRTPAHWSAQARSTDVGAAVRSTALTDFQVKQIQKAQGDGGLTKLSRLLRWNEYLLIETLGKGGMGVVYKGWDLANQRYVAIKRTHREGPEARKRLRREAALQKYLDHPNIAKLYSREKFGSADLLVLEYLPGSPLNEVVAKRKKEQKPLPWVFVAEMAVDLLDALDHAHGKNKRGVTVIHRDIKPANVMLMRTKASGGGEKYVPKLLDMGLAKWAGDKGGTDETAPSSMGSQLTGQFQLLGTPEYMPPEQWEGAGGALPESDTYALGGTLFYALTAELAFPVKNTGNKMAFLSQLAHLHKTADRPSVRAKRPDVPVEFDRLIQQMLAVPPSYRGKPVDLKQQVQAILAAPRSASRSGIMPASVRPQSPGSGVIPPPGERRKPLSESTGTVPRLVTPGQPSGSVPTPSLRTPGAPPKSTPPRDPEADAFLASLRADMLSQPPPGFGPKRPAASAPAPAPTSAPVSARTEPPRPPVPKAATPWAADPFPDPPKRPRASMDNLKAGVRNVRASAQLFVDGSDRERRAVADRVFDFVKDTARPHRNPVPLVLAAVLVLALGFAVNWMLAAWIGVLVAFAVGFAFVLTKSDE